MAERSHVCNDVLGTVIIFSDQCNKNLSFSGSLPGSVGLPQPTIPNATVRMMTAGVPFNVPTSAVGTPVLGRECLAMVIV